MGNLSVNNVPFTVNLANQNQFVLHVKENIEIKIIYVNLYKGTTSILTKQIPKNVIINANHVSIQLPSALNVKVQIEINSNYVSLIKDIMKIPLK